jgi:molybdate transport system substrate-binding protein
MTSLKVLSGGAALGLVTALAPSFERETGCAIDGTFDAVGSILRRLRDGAPADVLILTAKLIADLTEAGEVAAGSASDVGTVQTSVAVRAGDPVPAVATADGFRAALLAADEIHIPDPQQATAGIHVMKVLGRLGIAEEVGARLRPHPNGATAMHALAASPAARPLGCTQVTEILATPGLAVVGPLPPGSELATVYTAAVASRATRPAEAAALVALLTGDAARESRARAGFG